MPMAHFVLAFGSTISVEVQSSISSWNCSAGDDCHYRQSVVTATPKGATRGLPYKDDNSYDTQRALSRIACYLQGWTVKT